MEDAFFTIFGFFIIWVVYSFIRGAIRRATSGGGEDTAHYPQETFQNILTRAVNNSVSADDGSVIEYFAIEAKGPIPTRGRAGPLAVATSVFDVTDSSNVMPIQSRIDAFHEHETRFFINWWQSEMQPNMVYPDWVEVARVPKFAIHTPYRGDRALRFMTRWMDPDLVKEIQFGRLSDSGGVFGSTYCDITFHHSDKGFIETIEASKRATEISVTLALNMALIDGDLHDAEGEVIKKFTREYIGSFSGDTQETIKQRMNDNFQKSFVGISGGRIDTVALITELGDIGSQIDYFECLELLLDVMAADEIAHENELEFINAIGKQLSISPDEIQRLKDLHLISGAGISMEHSSLEEILGIQQDWSNETTCKYLRDQFMIWNARSTGRATPDEKERIGERLTLIAEARKKNQC